MTGRGAGTANVCGACTEPPVWRGEPHKGWADPIVYACDAHLSAVLPRDRPYDVYRIGVEV